MLAAEAMVVPVPTQRDIDEVQCALAVAGARWEHGDVDDALRWLRRAARAAADDDQLERALELSKAAAALSRRMAASPARKPVAHAARIGPPVPSSAMPIPLRRPEPTRPETKRPETERIPETQPVARPAHPAWRRREPPDSEQTKPRLRVPVQAAIGAAKAQPPRRQRQQTKKKKPSAWELPSLVGSNDDDDPTIIRFIPAKRATIPDVQTPPPPLTASRVAVMRDGQTGRPALVVLEPGASPPPGSAVAMLVGSSNEDALLLAELLYGDSGARKLP